MDRFFNSNRAMKGIAFLIALMLWMIVTLDEKGNSSIQPDEDQLIWDDVLVEAVYDEEQYTVLSMEETVQVVLTGRSTLLNLISLRKDAFRLYVDLTDLGEGGHRVPVQHQGFPEDVGVTIIPRSIYVELDRNETRTFGVSIELSGRHPEGYAVGQPRYSPSEVEVTAPGSLLSQVVSVKGVVDLGNLDRDGTAKVRLEAVDRQGEPIEASINPETIEVTVPVEVPSVKLPVDLRLVNELPDGLSLVDVLLETESVKVAAPEEVLNQLDTITATLDLNAIRNSQSVSLDFEKDRRWINVQPEEIQVHVEVAPTRERLFTGLPIRMVGLADHLEAEVISPAEGRLQLTVLGSQVRLDKLQRSDIRPWIDLEGLSEGRHRVPVHVDLPPYVSIDPETIEVDVEIRSR
jgi:YbbR domain-containing protein